MALLAVWKLVRCGAPNGKGNTCPLGRARKLRRVRPCHAGIYIVSSRSLIVMYRHAEFHDCPTYGGKEIRLTQPWNYSKFHPVQQSGFHPVRKREEPRMRTSICRPTEFPSLIVSQEIHFVEFLLPCLA